MPPRKLTLSQRLDPRLVLENSGSVARDHLASERTFLAYVRTSLVIASTGVGLVQLFTIAANSTTTSNMVFIPTSKRLQTYARPLGATIIAFSLIILVAGVIRYFTIQKALLTGMFPAARMFIFALTLILTVIIAIVFGVLIAGT
ncbi:hypothetical protein FISHEDRAFT_50133 [Fistulina hepatica ATCC 64428]|uniref:DUF202 domain-containing protein n=1 Tax=Fistulina hepatica ATCC 64428 TaxID=1128425 RepID=A0A0D7A2X5_9AGAR|nr:hypothetical protein FISHEDRAFT_50133 [Fistulina hepatica ATCC 64428]